MPGNPESTVSKLSLHGLGDIMKRYPRATGLVAVGLFAAGVYAVKNGYSLIINRKSIKTNAESGAEQKVGNVSAQDDIEMTNEGRRPKQTAGDLTSSEGRVDAINMDPTVKAVGAGAGAGAASSGYNIQVGLTGVEVKPVPGAEQTLGNVSGYQGATLINRGERPKQVVGDVTAKKGKVVLKNTDPRTEDSENTSRRGLSSSS